MGIGAAVRRVTGRRPVLVPSRRIDAHGTAGCRPVGCRGMGSVVGRSRSGHLVSRVLLHLLGGGELGMQWVTGLFRG